VGNAQPVKRGIEMSTPDIDYAGRFGPSVGLMVREILRREGGYQAGKNDAGNWTGHRVGVGTLVGTNYGVTAAGYTDWMRANGDKSFKASDVTKEDIQSLTPDVAAQIYYQQYWQRPKLAQVQKVFPEVAEFLFDSSVHHGAGGSVAILQRVIDPKRMDMPRNMMPEGYDPNDTWDDGAIGENTLTALSWALSPASPYSKADLMRLLVAERKAHIKKGVKGVQGQIRKNKPGPEGEKEAKAYKEKWEKGLLDRADQFLPQYNPATGTYGLKTPVEKEANRDIAKLLSEFAGQRITPKQIEKMEEAVASRDPSKVDPAFMEALENGLYNSGPELHPKLAKLNQGMGSVGAAVGGGGLMPSGSMAASIPNGVGTRFGPSRRPMMRTADGQWMANALAESGGFLNPLLSPQQVPGFNDAGGLPNFDGDVGGGVDTGVVGGPGDSFVGGGGGGVPVTEDPNTTVNLLNTGSTLLRGADALFSPTVSDATIAETTEFQTDPLADELINANATPESNLIGPDGQPIDYSNIQSTPHVVGDPMAGISEADVGAEIDALNQLDTAGRGGISEAAVTPERVELHNVETGEIGQTLKDLGMEGGAVVPADVADAAALNTGDRAGLFEGEPVTDAEASKVVQDAIQEQTGVDPSPEGNTPHNPEANPESNVPGEDFAELPNDQVINAEGQIVTDSELANVNEVLQASDTATAGGALTGSAVVPADVADAIALNEGANAGVFADAPVGDAAAKDVIQGNIQDATGVNPVGTNAPSPGTTDPTLTAVDDFSSLATGSTAPVTGGTAGSGIPLAGAINPAIADAAGLAALGAEAAGTGAAVATPLTSAGNVALDTGAIMSGLEGAGVFGGAAGGAGAAAGGVFSGAGANAAATAGELSFAGAPIGSTAAGGSAAGAGSIVNSLGLQAIAPAIPFIGAIFTIAMMFGGIGSSSAKRKALEQAEDEAFFIPLRDAQAYTGQWDDVSGVTAGSEGYNPTSFYDPTGREGLGMTESIALQAKHANALGRETVANQWGEKAATSNPAGYQQAMSRVPADFNWYGYLKSNPDLVRAGIDTPEEAKRHYGYFGHKENRQLGADIQHPGFQEATEAVSAYTGNLAQFGDNLWVNQAATKSDLSGNARFAEEAIGDARQIIFYRNEAGEMVDARNENMFLKLKRDGDGMPAGYEVVSGDTLKGSTGGDKGIQSAAALWGSGTGDAATREAAAGYVSQDKAAEEIRFHQGVGENEDLASAKPVLPGEGPGSPISVQVTREGGSGDESTYTEYVSMSPSQYLWYREQQAKEQARIDDAP
jgi:lysozyme family protein